MEDSQRTVNHSLRDTSDDFQKLTKLSSSRNQFLRRIIHRSSSEDGTRCQAKRGEGRGSQECRSVGGSPRLPRFNKIFMTDENMSFLDVNLVEFSFKTKLKSG